MKFIYPAVFHKGDDDLFHGYFPDLAECYGTGATLDEAIESANEACYDWISLELSEDDPMMPPVSEPSDIDLKEGDIIRNISVNIRLFDGWDE